MKKTGLTIIALFIIFSVSAQKKFNNYYSKRVHFGVKGGTNLTKIAGKGFDEQFKFNFLAGGFVQLKLTRGIAVQAEVLFVQSKADTTNDFSEVVDYVRFPESFKGVKLDYLTIPVLLNIGIGDSKAVKLQLGPQYSILLNKSQTLLQNGKQAFKTGELGAVGGIWIQLPLVHLSGRYVLGLDNLNDITSSTKWKSQSLQFSVGLTF